MSRAEELFERLQHGGISAIHSFILDRHSEELFLDFKRSADNGAGTKLHQNDRNNLGKAISGFGNSEGGVVVWGVDCSIDFDGADVARVKVPIVDAARFVSWLEGAVSGATVPPHTRVRHIPILDGSGSSGFAATLVPRGNHAPYQVVGRLQYFIRAGSDFVPTPHMVLAGLFGRTPNPHVYHAFSVTPAKGDGGHVVAEIGFIIRNDGPGIASDLFVNAEVLSTPGPNCQLAFERRDDQNWTGNWTFGRHVSLLSVGTLRLPPEAQVLPLTLRVSFAPPFERDFKLRGMVGAGNSPPYRFELAQTSIELQTAFDSFSEAAKCGDPSRQVGHDIAARLLGVREEPGAGNA